MVFMVSRNGINIGEVETSKRPTGRWEPVDGVDLRKGDVLESTENGERLEVLKNTTGSYLHSGLDLKPLG